MNRHYRGKRVDTKEWVYGYLFKIWEQTYILWGTTNGIPNMIEVIPETVGQSTGLEDKNGKEIYEGDILQDEEGTFVIKFDKEKCGFVLDEYGIKGCLMEYGWDEIAGGFGAIDTYQFDDFCSGVASLPPIVGNIYEDGDKLCQ